MNCMKEFFRVVVFIAIILFVSACKESGNKQLNKPVVKVNDDVLTLQQLYDAIPDGMSKDDSLIFSNDYQKRWVRAKLLLQRAELNLTPEEKDVDALLVEYRATLLIYKYQQKLVEQKYQSAVTDAEINDYYNQHTEDFRLWDPIVKGGYIRISKDAPNIESISSQIKRFRSADITALEGYCFQNARKYLFFPDEWKTLSLIIDELDLSITDIESFLQNDKYYETVLNGDKLFFVVSDFMLSGSQAPIEFVKERIRAIIVNKKRMNFIKEMESELYDDGIINGSVKFFK